jgi:hypothetical protein
MVVSEVIAPNAAASTPGIMEISESTVFCNADFSWAFKNTGVQISRINKVWQHRDRIYIESIQKLSYLVEGR